MDTPLPPLEVVLLAAGWSRRMGGVDKRLIPVQGEAMVRHSARLWRDLGLPVVVVGRAQDAALEAALAGLDVRIVANPDPVAEQGASARIGLSACSRHGAGVVIALADQPLLDAAALRWLIGCFAATGARQIAIPRHQGERGNPVILPIDLARALDQAPPALPPRRFIDAHADRIAWYDTPSPAFTADVDSPDDASRWLAATKPHET